MDILQVWERSKAPSRAPSAAFRSQVVRGLRRLDMEQDARRRRDAAAAAIEEEELWTADVAQLEQVQAAIEDLTAVLSRIGKMGSEVAFKLQRATDPSCVNLEEAYVEGFQTMLTVVSDDNLLDEQVCLCEKMQECLKSAPSLEELSEKRQEVLRESLKLKAEVSRVKQIKSDVVMWLQDRETETEKSRNYWKLSDDSL